MAITYNTSNLPSDLLRLAQSIEENYDVDTYQSFMIAIEFERNVILKASLKEKENIYKELHNIVRQLKQG